jgi:hypothetical protein
VAWPIHIIKRRALRRFRFAAGTLAVAAAALSINVVAATAGPTSTRIVRSAGEIVPIPASIPHEEGDMVDRRIVPDLRWIAARFPIYITDGYSGPLPNGEHVGCNNCHAKGSDHYNGLAVDIVPQHWSPTCDQNWRAITRLAKWAEPQQNHPVAPFRWVGYEGDAGHGCGNHLHLSWEHAPAPQFQLAEWVETFPVSQQELGHNPPPPPTEYEPTPAPPPAPPGGVSRTQAQRISHRQMGGISRARTWGRAGGISAHGD